MEEKINTDVKEKINAKLKISVESLNSKLVKAKEKINELEISSQSITHHNEETKR